MYFKLQFVLWVNDSVFLWVSCYDNCICSCVTFIVCLNHIHFPEQIFIHFSIFRKAFYIYLWYINKILDKVQNHQKSIKWNFDRFCVCLFWVIKKDRDLINWKFVSLIKTYFFSKNLPLNTRTTIHIIKCL